MSSLLAIAANNILFAAVLGILIYGLGRLSKRPALVHAMWVLVLFKLVTPPIVTIPLPWLGVDTNEKGSSKLAESPAETRSPGTSKQPVRKTPELVEPRLPEVETPIPLVRPFANERTEERPEAPVNLDQPQLIPETKPKTPEATRFPRTPIPQTHQKRLSWLLCIAVIWALGSCCWFALAAYRLLRFGWTLRLAKAASPDVQQQAHTLARRLGLKRSPDILFIPAVLSPMLCSVGWSLRLVIPEQLWRELDDERRATLLLHELAHRRRRDHWVRYLELLVMGLYWWCPLVWWIRRELHQAEEECCDAWVVWALPESTRAYASALMDTIDFLSRSRTALPVAATGLGQVYLLKRRLTMILRGANSKNLSRFGVVTLVVLGALLLPVTLTSSQSVFADGEKGEREVQRKSIKQERERREREDERERDRREPEREEREEPRRDDERREKEGDRRDRDREPDERERGERERDRRDPERDRSKAQMNERQRRMVQIRAEMAELNRNFEKVRRQFEERMRDLQMEMRKLSGEEAPRGLREGSFRRFTGEGGEGQRLGQRIEMLERKLEALMRELRSRPRPPFPPRPQFRKDQDRERRFFPEKEDQRNAERREQAERREREAAEQREQAERRAREERENRKGR
ncbi:MAG: M56 family metallopeptidase [Gemmataceae bacterium]